MANVTLHSDGKFSHLGNGKISIPENTSPDEILDNFYVTYNTTDSNVCTLKQTSQGVVDYKVEIRTYQYNETNIAAKGGTTNVPSVEYVVWEIYADGSSAITTDYPTLVSAYTADDATTSIANDGKATIPSRGTTIGEEKDYNFHLTMYVTGFMTSSQDEAQTEISQQANDAYVTSISFSDLTDKTIAAKGGSATITAPIDVTYVVRYDSEATATTGADEITYSWNIEEGEYYKGYSTSNNDLVVSANTKGVTVTSETTVATCILTVQVSINGNENEETKTALVKQEANAVTDITISPIALSDVAAPSSGGTVTINKVTPSYQVTYTSTASQPIGANLTYAWSVTSGTHYNSSSVTNNNLSITVDNKPNTETEQSTAATCTLTVTVSKDSISKTSKATAHVIQTALAIVGYSVEIDNFAYETIADASGETITPTTAYTVYANYADGSKTSVTDKEVVISYSKTSGVGTVNATNGAVTYSTRSTNYSESELETVVWFNIYVTNYATSGDSVSAIAKQEHNIIETSEITSLSLGWNSARTITDTTVEASGGTRQLYGVANIKNTYTSTATANTTEDVEIVNEGSISYYQGLIVDSPLVNFGDSVSTTKIVNVSALTSTDGSTWTREYPSLTVNTNNSAYVVNLNSEGTILSITSPTAQTSQSQACEINLVPTDASSHYSGITITALLNQKEAEYEFKGLSVSETGVTSLVTDTDYTIDFGTLGQTQKDLNINAYRKVNNGEYKRISPFSDFTIAENTNPDFYALITTSDSWITITAPEKTLDEQTTTITVSSTDKEHFPNDVTIHASIPAKTITYNGLSLSKLNKVTSTTLTFANVNESQTIDIYAYKTVEGETPTRESPTLTTLVNGAPFTVVTNSQGGTITITSPNTATTSTAYISVDCREEGSVYTGLLIYAKFGSEVKSVNYQNLALAWDNGEDDITTTQSYGTYHLNAEVTQVTEYQDGTTEEKIIPLEIE